MAVAPQAPGALDLWVVAGDPATWTVTLDGPTAIASPSWVLLDGIGGDEITGLDASAEVSGLDVTLDLSADDTAALKARDGQIKVTRVRHTIGLVVDGYGPVQVLAGEVELLPRGSAPRPPSQSSTSFSLANGLTVTVTVQLGGKTNLSATASPTGVTVVSSTGTDAVLPLADATNAGLMAPAQHSKLAGIEAGATADMTAAEILTAVKTVDGASSGLDADLLDGQHAAAFEAAGTAASAVAAHEAAADPHPTYTTAAELTSALAGKQPLDSDLTAIAALSTTSYGRSLLELANAAALATSVATQTAFSSRYLPIKGDVPIPMKPDVTMHAQACVSGHGWVSTYSAGGTVDLNYTGDYFIGNQAIRMTTNGAGAACRIDRLSITSFSMTARQPILWIKIVSGAQYLSNLELYLGDGGSSWTNVYRIDLRTSTNASWNRIREGEWYRLAVPWKVAFSNGSPTRGAIVQARVTVKDNSSGQAEVLIGGFGSQAEPSLYPNGVVTFTFDDGYDSVYTKGVPALDAYGWAGTAYPIVETIGGGGGMTLAQLQQMEAKGWDIGHHAYTYANHQTSATGLTTDELVADLAAQRKWLIDNGFKSSEHWAYPLGNYNASVLDVARQWFTACVTTRGEQLEPIYPGEPLRLARYGLNGGGSPTTLSDARGRIDAAVAQKGWQIFMLHKLAATAADSITWAESDFATLLAYCKTQGIAVKTMSEVINSVR